jgi:flagellar export protein FliJ
MKKFHFSLRPVAIMRAHRELCAREALAAATVALGRTEERLTATRGRMSELEVIIRTSRKGSFRAADGAAFGQAYRREWTAELDAQKQVATARSALDKSREACVEANRHLQVITRLEDQARSLHRQETQRVEQAEIDEMAGRRASRRRNVSP